MAPAASWKVVLASIILLMATANAVTGCQPDVVPGEPVLSKKKLFGKCRTLLRAVPRSGARRGA